MTRYLGVATDDMSGVLLREQLASQDIESSGAARVGYDGETVEQALDKAKSFPSYAELRAYQGMAEVIHITNPGIEGFFLESAEPTPVDNGSTLIVDALGRAWRRIVPFIDQSIQQIRDTHERLIFKKKKILSLPMKNPEWDYLVSVGIRFYPQTFCIDEDSQKLLIIDGTAANKAVLVYNWPSGSFDRLFFCSGGLVSEGAVVRKEGSSKFLYLRTTGDRLGKYDITAYPASRATISEAAITALPCGLNFMERNGRWTVSDIANGPLGNVRSRGKFLVTDSALNVVGSIDCGDYLMGIYAGRPGETDVTKTQGVTDTGYGLVAQMGGQWVYPNAVTNYSQNGLRIFTYDGQLVCEGLLQADRFRTMISEKWGFLPDLIESEGIVTTSNGDTFSLTVTSNNGLTNVATTHGMLILQEFCQDGEDFALASATRVSSLPPRGSLVSTTSGANLIDPATGSAITTIQQLVVAMQKSGIFQWTMYTTGLPLVDQAGASYQAGCLMTVRLFRSDIFYVSIDGFNFQQTRRIYLNGSGVWVEEVSGSILFAQTFTADGPLKGNVSFRYISNTQLQIRMRGDDSTVRSVTLTLA